MGEKHMLKHADIWRAIDRLAAKHGMSASGLARRSGLDPTTFNKSKRITKEGKQRWPSTESVSKILNATGDSLAEFVALMGEGNTSISDQPVPVIGFAQAGDNGYFDDAGYPTGSRWDEVLFPQIGAPHAFALEISGASMEPIYRNGDTIFVSPGAGIRRGDRVVVRTKEGEVMVKQLSRQSARKIELASLNKDHPGHSLDVEEIDWIARIVWASQ
jgi:phage repressor protein C with HTH and peptisase S24 domain